MLFNLDYVKLTRDIFAIISENYLLEALDKNISESFVKRAGEHDSNNIKKQTDH